MIKNKTAEKEELSATVRKSKKSPRGESKAAKR